MKLICVVFREDETEHTTSGRELGRRDPLRIYRVYIGVYTTETHIAVVVFTEKRSFALFYPPRGDRF